MINFICPECKGIRSRIQFNTTSKSYDDCKQCYGVGSLSFSVEALRYLLKYGIKQGANNE